MRPIKLTLQAFGPFAGEVLLDFRPALDQRLFGIYGPTGSGKTSILDGICFALFGQSSGEERQAPQLRSDHAADDVPTEVTLIFEVGAKRYYIRRSPAQSVAGRGGKLTTRQHTADLFDVTDVPIDEVGPENCGTPLAERKTGEVEAKVQELLGYSADQFRQVVLLPQGKFRKLLTANSKDRSEVLRGLFDVSIYGRFADRLKREADELRKDVETTEALIRGSLADQSLASRSELEDRIAQTEAEIVAIAEARALADAALGVANAAFEEGKHRGEKFAHLAAAREELAKLRAKSDEIDALRVKAAAAAKARGVQPVVEEAARAKKARADAATKLETRLADQSLAASTLQSAEEALKASLAAEPERAALTSHRISLDAVVQRLVAAEPLAETVKAATAAEIQAEKAHALAVTSAEAARASKEEARLAHEAAILRGGEIVELRSRVRDLELEEKAAETHRQSALRLGVLQSTADKAAIFHAGKKTAADVARAAHAEAERILADAQAAHLAAKLEDGAPCPVCGSQSHPDPATGDVLAAGRDNAFRQTLEVLQACDAEERQAHDSLITAKAQLESHRLQHEALTLPARLVDIIKEERLQAKARLDQLEIQPAKEALLLALSGAEASANSALQALEEQSKALAQARTVKAAAAASLQNELSTVPEALRSSVEARRALQSAQDAEFKAIKAHANCVEAEQRAREKVTLEANNVAHAREVLAAAEDVDAAAQARRGQALTEAGLTMEAFEAARADIPSLETLQGTILAHDNACTVAEARLQAAEEAAEDLEPPDMEALQSARAGASQAQHAIMENGATAHSTLSTLSQLHASILSKEALIVTKRQRYELVGELSDLSSGKNDKRLRLLDFAILATFEDVLEAANLRFEKMSRGRYSLIRKEDLSRSGAVSGLEIQVFDAQTEKARDAGTVSGGEGFLASLALALGLSDVIQSEAGGIKLDAIFIDEGFDQLDSDTLDLALNTLSDLVASDRAIGMISHVDAVKETIPAAFQLRHGLKGSIIEPQSGLEL